MRMRTATGQKMIQVWAYSRSIHEPDISQLVSCKGGVQNEMPRFIRTAHEIHQVAPLSEFTRTRCNWRGWNVILLFVYIFYRALIFFPLLILTTVL